MAKKWDKEVLRQNLSRFEKAVQNEQKNMTNFIEDRLNQTLKCFEELVNQIPLSMSGPLLTKTPAKPAKKKTKKIMTIPEDDVAEARSSSGKEEEAVIARPKRTSRLSKKPQEVAIKREAIDDDYNPVRKTRASKRINELAAPKDSPKVKKSRLTKKRPEPSSGEEDSEEEVAKVKTKKVSKSRTVRSLSVELDSMVEEPAINATVTISKKEDRSRKRTNQIELDQSVGDQPEEPPKKKANMEEPVLDRESNEISFYEDAVEKHNLLSSTLNLSQLQKKMALQPIVVLNSLPVQTTSNETFVVDKKSSTTKMSSRTNSLAKQKSSEEPAREAQTIRPASSCSSADSLITDDESEHVIVTKQKHKLRSSFMSDDDLVEMTPPTVTKANAKQKTATQIKNNFKNGALFSPYMKESVEKRVEAFEQVAAASPQKETATTSRVTRTKTRAQKAACEDVTDNEKSAEDTDDESDAKENIKKQNDKAKLSKLPQSQLKYTTPLGKNRIPVATSTSKMYTPINANSHAKPLTAQRLNNLVTNVDSFIPKSTSKFSSADKSDEKRRKMSTTDDAKLKRDNHLKAMAEEKKKKREIKEQKIKQAREAKEKQEMEKRMKAEKEREEKAKLAQIAQEKTREEMERKRLAHLQRVQEKEERRKKEEQIRLQKAQEQEELERQLAEQRRQEQELEKKKLAEARAYQQQAQAEALKQKMLAKKLAQASKKTPNTYKLDSEPDDDSDSESNPKHPVPEWASGYARDQPLIAQSYVPKQAIMRLFNTSRWTPDLTKLFDGISKSRLKRTSSAIWKSPPRYSIMYENL